MSAFPTLQSKRIKIASLSVDDAVEFHRYRADKSTNKFLSFEPESIDQTSDFLKQQPKKFNQTGTWFQLGVYLEAQLIGDIGLHFVDDQQVEIGYTLNPAFRGAGYMQEALRLVISHLLKKLNKHRIFASVDPENTPSIKLLYKLGFRKEAHHVKSLWFKGQWVDDLIFAILKEEKTKGLKK